VKQITKPNAQAFRIRMAKQIQTMQKDREEAATRIVLSLFSAVVMKTPVDTGRARANWFPSMGSPVQGHDPAASDKSGANTLANIERFLYSNRIVGEGVVWLTNNLPYIEVLEYGGFPNPPKYERTKGRGVWDKINGWGSKVVGGFSSQAPNGMVRVTLEEFKSKSLIEAMRVE
jgi:hypothetical protein